MRATDALFLAWAVSWAALAQPSTREVSPTAVISFTYENDKGFPSYYRLTIRQDGSGTYESRGGSWNSISPDKGIAFQQPISLSPALLQETVAAAHQHRFFAIGCEATGLGNIAFQGRKTLAYEGSDGTGQCVFNYSKIKQIQKLSDTLQSIASTLEAGRRLAVEHQHDKLSLDAELAALEESVAAGRSSELQNIRPMLEEISADPNVMNRARQRAALLAASATH